jgi:hypothetical protein
MSANAYSPVILVSNWLNEAKLFFNDRDLRAREWSAEAFSKDTRESTIWVVKITQLRKSTMPFYKYFWGEGGHGMDVIIESTWCDEAHIFGRSTESTQNRLLRVFTTASRFNVMISGTLFPLGPSQDAINVLTSLGGDVTSNSSKWKVHPSLQRGLERLLVASQSWPTDNPLLALRFLIAPIVLRRTTSSTWDGKYVVGKSIARPVPKVLKPAVDEYTEKAGTTYIKARFKKGRAGRHETEQQKVARADAQKAFAWTPLFEKISDETATLPEHQRQIETQNIIRNALAEPGWARSTRILLLLQKVLSIVKAGKRFVIVADRIFLLTFIFGVSISLLALSTADLV